MNCKKCGAPLTAGDQFCKNCGQSVNGPIQNNNSNGGSKLTIVLVVIIVLLVGVVGYFLLNKNNTPTPSGDNENNNPATPTTTKVQTYKINYSGYTFEIPNNYTYKTTTDGFTIVDDAETVAGFGSIVDGSYSVLKSRHAAFKTRLATAYTITNDGYKTYDGREYMVFEVVSNGQNVILALTKLDEVKTLSLSIANVNNTIDYKDLETFHSMVKTVKYTGAANSIKIENPNLNEIITSVLN